METPARAPAGLEGEEHFKDARQLWVGHSVPTDQHATEVLGRILRKGQSLTEDAVFLAMYHVLRPFAGSVFDFSYIVHPDGSQLEDLADLCGCAHRWG